MRPTQLATWIGIAFVLASFTAWAAEVCHSPITLTTFEFVPTGSGATQTTRVDRITESHDYFNVAEIGPGSAIGDSHGPFNVYYHPYGFTLITTKRNDIVESILPGAGPVYEDGCGFGDNENAGYQLKIFSKQNPTFEKFDKPILVTQGFDSLHGVPDKQFDFDRFERLLNQVFDENNTDHRVTAEIGLLRQLYDEGYDIALLLWKNPNIDIKTNAVVTLQALRWLQEHTDTTRDGTEPVIIGPSLGGLVTRYALQLAGTGLRASDIRARLFIAFDSPNRGAEIPMSLQALVSYLREQGGVVAKLYENLTNKAGRQLLLSSVLGQEDTGTPSQQIVDYEGPSSPANQTAPDHGEFIQYINLPDFRRDIKNIVHHFAGSKEPIPIYVAALINGSGTGRDGGLPEGATYLHMSHTTVGLELRTASAGESVRVFHGNVAGDFVGIIPTHGKDPLDYNFKEFVFMENAPGGLRSTYNSSFTK